MIATDTDTDTDIGDGCRDAAIIWQR